MSQRLREGEVILGQLLSLQDEIVHQSLRSTISILVLSHQRHKFRRVAAIMAAQALGICLTDCAGERVQNRRMICPRFATSKRPKDTELAMVKCMKFLEQPGVGATVTFGRRPKENMAFEPRAW